MVHCNYYQETYGFRTVLICRKGQRHQYMHSAYFCYTDSGFNTQSNNKDAVTGFKKFATPKEVQCVNTPWTEVSSDGKGEEKGSFPPLAGTREIFRASDNGAGSKR